MRSFLEEVVQEVNTELDSLENVIFILPSKRAGVFLRNAIAKNCRKTIFSPEILSIELFVENISGLKTATQSQQLFTLYKAHSEVFSESKDDFHTFSKWANTLLQDFNEIDRHLVDSSELFSNLADIQEISHWSPEFKRTEMMDNYLKFWNNLRPLYLQFANNLLTQKIGHQGLIYRKAVENLDEYALLNTTKTHIFIGFNALNKSESEIIQKLISQKGNQLYWDIDKYFLEDPVHDAAYFLRSHLKNWPYYSNNDPKGISNHYLSQKNINIVGLPKNISQAKQVGNILANQQLQDSDNLKRTAVILGDEGLLNPILNSIPETVKGVNITMGYPLAKSSLADLFGQLLDLHINKDSQGWYHRPILNLLSHAAVQTLFSDSGTNHAQQIIADINATNQSHIKIEQLIKICPGQEENLYLLFARLGPSPSRFLSTSLQIIERIRVKLDPGEEQFRLEHLYRFHQLLNQILQLVQKHSFIENLKSLKSLYQQLLAHETLDFTGEPLEGLQVMGMLESRNLDFETIILTSVNEGILPSGKTNNSFIPYDLKLRFGLPTYKEKDAVYTYHFYRLLQRAKNVYLLYNTEPDVLEGSEKSRLLMQLLTDSNRNADIVHTSPTSDIPPTDKVLQSIAKEEHLMELIKGHAETGFSPSSLSNYIRNPVEFYKKNLLKIDEVLEVEETVAANTFGTIIHNTLEELYSPFIGKILTEEKLIALRPAVERIVKAEFEKTYGGNTARGKNLIALNVIIKYIENFISVEIAEVRNHQIKILGLEEKLSINIDIPELNFPIVLKGKLDRVDEKDGETRIIDFKTGKVERAQVEIFRWEDVIEDYNRNKAFQLLCYAKMYSEKYNSDRIQAGIVAIKKMNSGLFQFALKDSQNSRTKDSVITQEALKAFTAQLKKLILEICNPQIPFIEKKV